MIVEIRSTKMVKKYKEAKEFVKEYEAQYFLSLGGGCNHNDKAIRQLRCEIVNLLERLKRHGMLDNKEHPLNKSIAFRRRLLKAKLREKLITLHLPKRAILIK